MTVVLINAFEVPEAKDAFLTFWERAADLLRRQAGFVGTKLHRAISPEPHYRFVNVAEWESPQHFQDAIGSEDFRHLSADAPPYNPALYEVVRNFESLVEASR